MRAASSRRIFRSRLIRIALFIVLIWTFLEALYIHRNFISEEVDSVLRVNTEKVFITGLAWNNEIVYRTHIINQIRDLVHVLGIENVYISLYENGSYDDTKGALGDFQSLLEELGVRNRIVLDQTSHEDIVNSRPTEPRDGWIQIEQSGFEKVGIQKGDYALRRIHYLAELRNKALEPLWKLEEQGEKFDKILFLNDVVFTSDDVLKLLQTNDGRYATVCSLDFETPPAFYDTFALRDSEGNGPLMRTWPFFRSAESRNAVIRNRPVPVQSCWNGLIAMSTRPFYNTADHLRFRGISDSLALKHVEGSECCLIHADNPLSSELGVWINPNVRVGYCHPDLQARKVEPSWKAYTEVCQRPYDSVHPHGSWVSYLQIARGLFANRLRRWVSWEWMDNGKARARLRSWRSENGGNTEPGEMCLVNEMHVIEPHGWVHV